MNDLYNQDYFASQTNKQLKKDKVMCFCNKLHEDHENNLLIVFH